MSFVSQQLVDIRNDHKYNTNIFIAQGFLYINKKYFHETYKII